LSPAIYGEWLARQGHTIIRTESSYWHSGGNRVYQAFPYQWQITPGRQELRDLFRRHRALAVRYSAPAGASDGIESYHAVRSEKPYDFETLSHWARKNVRRGLKNCVVDRVPAERFIDEGWLLRVDSLSRQGRQTGDTFEKWGARIRHAAELEGFEFWAASVRDESGAERMGAFVLTFRMGDCINMVLQQCHRDFLKEHVNNALSFAVTQEMLSRPEVASVFYGLESLDAPPSVDEYKFRMGYEAVPVKQCVAFHPLAAPLVNRLTYAALNAAVSRWPERRTLSKTAGMVRVYLEGRTGSPALAAPNDGES
jgi:hypothetical protein